MYGVGRLEYWSTWSTYSVLLRFGGDGTLISGNAGVRNKLSDQAALLLARLARAQRSVSESRKGRERGKQQLGAVRSARGYKYYCVGQRRDALSWAKLFTTGGVRSIDSFLAVDGR